ncbi:hypothetical protein K1X76_07710 [bacterium]|nr:hypothetical protein [bacterium]
MIKKIKINIPFLFFTFLFACGGAGSPAPTPPDPPTGSLSTMDTLIEGVYSADGSETSSGCEYSVCGSSGGTDHSFLILDKNKHFFMCRDWTSFSGTSLPGIGISDYSSNHGSWCAYGTFESKYLLYDDSEWTEESNEVPDRVSLILNAERYINNPDTFSCYQNDEKLKTEDYNNTFFDFEAVDSFSTSADDGWYIEYEDTEELKVKSIDGMEQESEINSNNSDIFNSYLIAMGLSYNANTSSITITKPCHTYEERELINDLTLTPENGTYYQGQGSGYYEFDVPVTRGDFISLVGFTNSGNGYLIVFPVYNDSDYIDKYFEDYVYPVDPDNDIYFDFTDYYNNFEAINVTHHPLDETSGSFYNLIEVNTMALDDGHFIIRFRNATQVFDDEEYNESERDNFVINYLQAN